MTFKTMNVCVRMPSSPKVLERKIQKRRKELELPQEDVDYKVGISRAYMGYIEQGKYAPSLEVIEKIAKALKSPIGNFF